MLQLYINYYYVDNFALLLGNHKNLTSIKNERWKKWMCTLLKDLLRKTSEIINATLHSKSDGNTCCKCIEISKSGEIQVQPSSSIICCRNLWICTISANHKKKGNVSWMSSSCAAISRVCVCLTQYCFQNKQLIMFLLCSQCYLWWDLPISSQLSTRDSIPLWSKWLSPLWPH